MTGRELIIFILQNNLEDEQLDGFMDTSEAAVKFGVGLATIRAWYDCGLLKGFKTDQGLYILINAEDPRKRKKLS